MAQKLVNQNHSYILTGTPVQSYASRFVKRYRSVVSCALNMEDIISCSFENSVSSSVGIATRYGLDGPGIESGWGRDFPHPSRPASYTMGTVYFAAVKRPERGVDHTPPSSAEVEVRVELYICFPLGLRGLF